MTALSDLGVPHVWLVLKEDGSFADGFKIEDILGKLSNKIKKIVIISHGWKTNIESAAQQYAPLWSQVLAHRPATKDDTLLVCLNWPSKTYDPEFINNLSQTQINALSAAPVKSSDLSDADLKDLEAEAATLLDIDPAKLAAAVDKAVATGQAETLFKLVARAVRDGADEEVVEGTIDPAANPQGFRAGFNTMQNPASPSGEKHAAAGLGEIVGKIVKGPKMAAAWVLNQATYYQMKKRAGIVGRNSRKPFLRLRLTNLLTFI